MNDINELLSKWYWEDISNIELYHFVQEMGEVEFFLGLPKYLDYSDYESETYKKISLAYYRARKYFEEH